MNKMIPFQFGAHSVRVIANEKGEPLFVGKDVCKVLGYANAATAMLDHCRGVAICYPIPDSMGRMQETRVLAEPDMMRLTVNCTLPAGVAFEKMVFEDILPTIRKTGRYASPGADASDLSERAARALEVEMRLAAVFGIPAHVAQNEAVKEVRSRLGYDASRFLALAPAHDQLLPDEVYLEPTELGRLFERTAQQINQMLQVAGLQEKIGKEWVPTEAGKPFSSIHAWTKGAKSGYNLKWQAAKVRALVQN